MAYTVDDMIRTLRSKLQEQNNSKVSDADILDFLNQGQDFAFDIVARRYPDSIAAKAVATLDTPSSAGIFTMPEDAFEQRLTRVYRQEGNYTIPLEAVGYREIDDFSGKQGIPTHYAIMKNKVHLLPNENLGNYTFQYAYVQDIESFVKPQGRITSIIADGTVDSDADMSVTDENASITVDSIGSDLSIDSASLNRFVNIVDSQSGLVKVSLELKTLDTTTNTITFKSTDGLTRTKVDNKTIVGNIASAVEADDYICLSSGSCVPYFQKPTSNYILQWAAVELKRSLGMDAQMESNALRKYEEQLEKMNSKRESSSRVYRRRHPRNDRRW